MVTPSPAACGRRTFELGCILLQVGAGLALSRTEKSAVRDPVGEAFVVLSLRSLGFFLVWVSLCPVYFPALSGHSVQPFDLNRVLQSQKHTLCLIFPLCLPFTLCMRLLGLLI